MSDYEKPCPFCGSTNLKSGGDDKIVGTWCLECQARGPNHYGRYEWNDRADRIEELEAALRKSALQELSALGQASEAYQEQLAAEARTVDLEAKLTNQKHMIAQVFALLDVTEETEDGRVFHPNKIRSSRALDAEKLDALLAELRDTLTANEMLFAFILLRR